MAELRPGITVVVPSYERPESLARCLAAIAAQTVPPAETLVVCRSDDANTRDVAVATQPEARVRVVAVERTGQVAALNAGRREVGTEIVAFTDDDAAPRRDWLERIAEKFRSDPRLGAVGGRDLLNGGTAAPVAAGKVGVVLSYGRRLGNHHLGGHPGDVHILKGVNMSYRMSALLPFDERLRGAGAERGNDMEVSLSVGARGWRVSYDPAIAVDHFPAPRAGREPLPEGKPLEDIVHNEAYALLRWLPWPSKAAVFGYGTFVGTRTAPGVWVLGWLLLTGGGGRRAAVRRFLSAQRGWLAGLLTWRDASNRERR